MENVEVTSVNDSMGDGWVNIPMNERFLYKNNCVTHAKILLMHKYITGMTEEEIAQEIFAHAVCYYWYDPNGNFFRSNPISKELYEHCADGIYVQNGGDTAVRKTFYKLVWDNFTGK